MDGRKIILLVGALMVAAVSAFMARTMISGASAPQATAAIEAPRVVGPEVLVATRALPVGTILDASALKFQPWPKELVDNAYFLRDSTDLKSLQGTVVRNPITAGQPVTQGSLVKPGDRGFLAAALGPGMRAVTVPVSAQTGVAGFVFPGDHVDLILTQSVTGGGAGAPLKVSETVVRNLRVLATDQRTDNRPGDDGQAKVATFSNVTVEATPKIAQQIELAQSIGTLSLSLRSIADNGTQFEQVLANGRKGGTPDTDDIRLASAPTSGDPSYSTGADISRYQRSTVPGKEGGADGPPQFVGAASTAGAGADGGASGATITGPVVRVARGNTVTVVPVGGK